LSKRLEAGSAAGSSELGLKQVNALYSLVGDRYKTKVCSSLGVGEIGGNIKLDWHCWLVSDHRILTRATEQPDILRRSCRRTRGRPAEELARAHREEVERHDQVTIGPKEHAGTLRGLGRTPFSHLNDTCMTTRFWTAGDISAGLLRGVSPRDGNGQSPGEEM